jgi:hypothetical protein
VFRIKITIRMIPLLASCLLTLNGCSSSVESSPEVTQATGCSDDFIEAYDNVQENIPKSITAKSDIAALQQAVNDFAAKYSGVSCQAVELSFDPDETGDSDGTDGSGDVDTTVTIDADQAIAQIRDQIGKILGSQDLPDYPGGPRPDEDYTALISGPDTEFQMVLGNSLPFILMAATADDFEVQKGKETSVYDPTLPYCRVSLITQATVHFKSGEILDFTKVVLGSDVPGTQDSVSATTSDGTVGLTCMNGSDPWKVSDLQEIFSGMTKITKVK